MIVYRLAAASACYGLYLLKGKAVFVYNLLRSETVPAGRVVWAARDWLGDSLKPGKHTIEFDFKLTRSRHREHGGIGCAERRTAGCWPRKKVEHTIPFLMPGDETFDVGVDTRTMPTCAISCRSARRSATRLRNRDL